ncbi:DUF805 domain-containing protein [Pseudovibrio sp. JE062]|uniref:DUF805 domain-containing protein n=1 Tax=Pseudovibrio sp. JE062 TaxID=439495 RepID=UPI000186C0F7|nr:DUF805 domain-containing protein [Pseudovibrio sp. JE062]EEA92501.1 conserved hypothetical protein [Pseudovibrio sp. JE062]
MAYSYSPGELTFKDAVITCLKNYFNFYGRASRAEYWWWFFFNILVMSVAFLFDILIVSGFAFGISELQHSSGTLGAVVVAGMFLPFILTMIVALLLLLPTLTVAVRRLHDVDRSGFWVFITVIPILGTVLLLYWHLLPSSQTVSANYE